jgi:hypothetical protein
VQSATSLYKGNRALANWQYVKNGVTTSVAVFAADAAYRENSSTNNKSWMIVGIENYTIGEACINDYFGYNSSFCYPVINRINDFWGYGEIGLHSFRMEGSNGALLNATITGYDEVTRTSKTIIVAVDWNATGQQLHQSNGPQHWRLGNDTEILFGDGFWSRANATGSITGDITMNLGDSNQNTELSRFKSGFVIITKS